MPLEGNLHTIRDWITRKGTSTLRVGRFWKLIVSEVNHCVKGGFEMGRPTTISISTSQKTPEATVRLANFKKHIAIKITNPTTNKFGET